MADQFEGKTPHSRRIRHRGRLSQIPIYLGKQFRFFINQNDWKVLPMAAVIAALVAMVIRKQFFVTMEGSLIGGFALACVAIWNGCFNSIQSVCRERPIIKREHRSGLHISSYVAAHMIYQFLLCAAQTVLTLFVLNTMGISMLREGFIGPFIAIDLGISMLLISYASDMMSLLISSLSHTTTGAMTVMPFVLIFQLVFSGGLIPLPEWSQPLSNFTISSYGIRVIAAQSGYNERPMATGWKTLEGMRDTEVGGSVTIGELRQLADNPALAARDDMQILPGFTVGEIAGLLESAGESIHLRDRVVAGSITPRELLTLLSGNDALAQWRQTELTGGLTIDQALNLLLSMGSPELLDQPLSVNFTVGEALDTLRADELVEQHRDEAATAPVTLGQVRDFLKNSPVLDAWNDRAFAFRCTIGELFELVGEQNIKDYVQARTAEAAYKEEYALTLENVIGNWLMLAFFALVYALLATIVLELIDRDKR